MEHLPVGVSILRQLLLTGRGMLLVHVESLSIGASVCGVEFIIVDEESSETLTAFIEREADGCQESRQKAPAPIV